MCYCQAMHILAFTHTNAMASHLAFVLSTRDLAVCSVVASLAIRMPLSLCVSASAACNPIQTFLAVPADMEALLQALTSVLNVCLQQPGVCRAAHL